MMFFSDVKTFRSDSNEALTAIFTKESNQMLPQNIKVWGTYRHEFDLTNVYFNPVQIITFSFLLAIFALSYYLKINGIKSLLN